MTVTDDPARRLACDGCFNVRDIGGYQTIDGARIRWRTLLRGDNLCRLTPDGCAALLRHGVRTIVDLRGLSEVEAAPHPFGPDGPHPGAVSYWHWPLRDPDDAGLQQDFQAVRGILASYRFSLDRCAPRIAAIARAFADAPDGGVLIHCHVGKDRTGVVIALLLALAGVPTETIVADYALSEGYLRPLYEARRAAGLAEAYDAWRSEPATMLALLDHLERTYGGAEAYLLAAGLTSDVIGRVRRRLRE